MKTESEPIEITRLLNPAFCGQILMNFIQKYEKVSETGVPYSLIFFVLPMVLHKDTRSLIPSVSRLHFHAWLMENQSVLIGLHTRTKQLIPITKKAILFLSYFDSLEIKNGCIHKKKFQSNSNQQTILEIQDIFKKAETLGKWFGKAGTENTIYKILGVQP